MASQPQPNKDRIAAVATPPGRGGVGMIRVSGADLGAYCHSLTGVVPEARRAQFCRFRGADGAAIDEGLVLYFPAPRSFTGEDVVELHGHGGPVVMGQLLARCVELGARIARPGEFSERAFLNGKMDLVQAEAIADLIDASTATAARSALRSMCGSFSKAINALGETLVSLRALAEATLDFADEEVDGLTPSAARDGVARVSASLAEVYRRAHRGQLLRDGLTVVLVGAPNVGKSSLLNRLAGEEVAIVSEYAGTTRDSLQRVVQVRGMPLHIVDTAGLRATDDPIERMGIARTWREIERADVVLLIADAVRGLDAGDSEILARLPPRLRIIRVLNKVDLAPPAAEPSDGFLRVSALTGDGVDQIEEALLDAADWHPGEDSFIARERHLDALRRCEIRLAAAAQNADALELFAEELRLAHLAVQEITGEFTPDDLLGRIFSTFCIGK